MAQRPASERDRAYGALLGLAIGDALGMPTQGFSRKTIAARWGVLTGFEPAPDDNPISRGLPAGHVTDDTEQAVILGRLLERGRGRLDPYAFADALLDWEQRMSAAGSLDLLGPSTRRALSDLRAGVPIEETGRHGDTNGAAMRIAPVGIATRPEPLTELVDAVEDACRVTHHTGLAIAGAAAIAAAVSAGAAGASTGEALDLAMAAARLGAARGNFAPGAQVADRTAWAIELTRSASSAQAVLDVLDRLVGTSLATQESVPAALAIVATFPDDPWDTCRYAASAGGDCDTIAAMAGAVAGAVHGASAFPADAVDAVLAANPELHLDELTQDLLTLRTGRLHAEPPAGVTGLPATRAGTP